MAVTHFTWTNFYILSLCTISLNVSVTLYASQGYLILIYFSIEFNDYRKFNQTVDLLTYEETNHYTCHRYFTIITYPYSSVNINDIKCQLSPPHMQHIKTSLLTRGYFTGYSWSSYNSSLSIQYNIYNKMNSLINYLALYYSTNCVFAATLLNRVYNAPAHRCQNPFRRSFAFTGNWNVH